MNRSPQATQSASEPRRLICVGDPETLPADINRDNVIVVDTSVAVVDQLNEPSVDGVWIARDQLPQMAELRGIAQSGIMLRDMPEGAALLDSDVRILWSNRRLSQWSQQDATGRENDDHDRSDRSLVGLNFYE